MRTSAESPVFGFTYQHQGREYAMHVEAGSADEALAKIAAMANAKLYGELHRSQEVSAAG